jgi:hypothetical protein
MPTLNAFLIALRMMESGGDYQAVNTLNFLGAYQFGEAALTDLGYVHLDNDALDNNYSGGWTGKNGIDSAKEFLASKKVQDTAAEAWVKLMWHYIESENMGRYAWTEVGDVLLTPSGMLAATHLLGPYALKEFIQSDGTADLRDPYGMPIVSYIDRLAGYDIPFAPKDRRVASAGTAADES